MIVESFNLFVDDDETKATVSLNALLYLSAKPAVPAKPAKPPLPASRYGRGALAGTGMHCIAVHYSKSFTVFFLFFFWFSQFQFANSASFPSFFSAIVVVSVDRERISWSFAALPVGASQTSMRFNGRLDPSR